MNKLREKGLVRLGLADLGFNLREEISNVHTDRVIEFIKLVVKTLEKASSRYCYYPYEKDLDYLKEFYDPNRHITLGDIAVQIEINSITYDY